jgi:hypothetical protein
MYVQPEGDFDGKAARRLINLLHDEDQGRGRVFIDTSHLGRMHARACALFKEGLNRASLTGQRLVFVGFKGRVMAHPGEQVVPDASLVGMINGPLPRLGNVCPEQEVAA